MAFSEVPSYDEVAWIPDTYIAIAVTHAIELLVYIYFWIVAFGFYSELDDEGTGDSDSVSPVERF